MSNKKNDEIIEDENDSIYIELELKGNIYLINYISPITNEKLVLELDFYEDLYYRHSSYIMNNSLVYVSNEDAMLSFIHANNNKFTSFIQRFWDNHTPSRVERIHYKKDIYIRFIAENIDSIEVDEGVSLQKTMILKNKEDLQYIKRRSIPFKLITEKEYLELLNKVGNE